MTRRSLMSGCGTMLLVLLPTIVSGQEHHRQHWLHITNTSNCLLATTAMDHFIDTVPSPEDGEQKLPAIWSAIMELS